MRPGQTCEQDWFAKDSACASTRLTERGGQVRSWNSGLSFVFADDLGIEEVDLDDERVVAGLED
jgi:hypothetical protein